MRDPCRVNILLLLGACSYFAVAQGSAPSHTYVTQAAAVEAEPRLELVAAADGFVGQLSEDMREQAIFAHGAAEQFDWHYVPRSRPGVSLEQLNPAQRRALFRLLQASTGRSGYRQAIGVIALEGILWQMQSRADFRHPGRYFATLYGQPARDKAWGWRLEGHHLSLNFTAHAGQIVASTPAFWGANPARVPSGSHLGWRALAKQEELAFALLNSLSDEQRSKAIISRQAPREILTGVARRVDPFAEGGLAVESMSVSQRAALTSLIDSFLDTAVDAVAHRVRQRLSDADDLRFVWAGATSPGEPHYYRIQSSALIIEYDNYQNGANHVHAVWRDPSNDFGENLLRSHYERAPHHHR